ncbi:hypothetical protein ACN4EG_04930 [Alkalinema pantanalense CENA528]|uniref:hypothetical protein n=1 Tax=Alkalinema pantanalense TaxID=1620705 RepID=UPI003D6EA18E
MTSTDLLLLTIYFLCVTYVLYQIINSFNDEFTIKLEKGELEEWLNKMKLKDWVEISFNFDGRYEFDKLKELAISIKNKSNEYPIYVDWDYSSITDLDGKARRVTRLTPGTTLDLFQDQAFSAIAPGTTLKEKIVAEDMLKRKGDNGEMEIAKTLIDLSKPGKPGPPLTRYLEFIALQRTLQFSLDLVFRFVDNDTPVTGYRTRVPMKFTMSKLHWTAGLPWNPKK